MLPTTTQSDAVSAFPSQTSIDSNHDSFADEQSTKSKSLGASLSRTIHDHLHHVCEEKDFQELQSIEKRRRALLQKSYKPTLRVLFSFRGTFLYYVLFRDAFLWITMGIYVLIRLLARAGIKDWIPRMDVSVIGAIGALVSFFLVYFQVDAGNRYMSMYLASMKLLGRISDLALLVSSQFSPEDAYRFMRYMNAAHVLGYVGLSEAYTMSNFFHPLNQGGLYLTDAEISRVTQLSPESGGKAYREVLSWCMDMITDNVRNKTLLPETVPPIQNQITAFRGAFGDIYDLIDQPIVFMYLHFAVFISAVYLPLFAVSVGNQMGLDEFHWTSDVLGAVAVFLQCAFVVGLRIIAMRQMQPYENDIEDFSVLTYVTDVYDNSMKLVGNPPRTRGGYFANGPKESCNDNTVLEDSNGTSQLRKRVRNEMA